MPPSIPSATLAQLFLDLTRTVPELPGDDLTPGLKRDTLYTRGLFLRPEARLPAPSTENPLVRTVAARARIVSGDAQTSCPDVRALLANRASLPKPLFAELLVLGGVCAVATGNPSGAALAGQLARDAGYRGPITLNLLEAHNTAGAKPLVAGTLAGVDAALLRHDTRRVPDRHLATATPAALAVLAVADSIAVPTRLAAAERAAQLAIITPATLAKTYEAAIALRVADPVTSATRRARLYLKIRDNRAFLQRARNIRAFLDSARTDGLYLPALEVVAPFAAELPKIPEIGWFAQTGIETAIAAGEPDQATAWADFGEQLDVRPRNGYSGWRALIAVTGGAGKTNSASLEPLERMALERKFKPDDLHRLATVLDALNLHVPIGLWNAASATPQPKSGHLPPTGVLRKLADASKARATGPTVMLAIATLGPDGPAKANILALGDTIRALVRLGRTKAARRLAYEAIFDTWPRAPVN